MKYFSDINERFVVKKRATIVVKDYPELRALVTKRLQDDVNADLNDIDVSNITVFGGKYEGLFRDLDPHDIKLGNWNMQNAESTENMFCNCRNFIGSDIGKWGKMNKIKSMKRMFYNCHKFTGDLSGWSINKTVYNASSMFWGCTEFTGKGLSSLANMWGPPGKISSTAWNMFGNCISLDTDELETWNVADISHLAKMFQGCKSFTGKGLEHWGPKLTNDSTKGVNNMFAECENLDFDVSSWANIKFEQDKYPRPYKTFNTSTLTKEEYRTGLANMFRNCKNFKGKGLEKWNVDNVTTFSLMFFNCESLNFDCSKWNMEKAWELYGMFKNCVSFTGEGLENWNIDNATAEMKEMFYNCTAITAPKFNNWKMGDKYCKQSLLRMFTKCNKKIIPEWSKKK